MRRVRAGDLLDPAFARLAPQLAARDRAWVQELVYGTFRLRGRLDHLLERFLRRPRKQLELDVLDTLRLGAYQLLYMKGVPAYAAVSQAVEMARAVGARGATGLVNGVLQSLRRAEPELLPEGSHDTVEFLCTWGAHPEWLVKRWVRAFGSSDTEKLVAANNQRPDVFLGLLGEQPEHAEATLREEGFQLEPVPHVPGMLRLVDGDVARALTVVPAVVQDPAALLVARYAAFGHDWVADLCAAPGGKTLSVRARSQARFVLAGDASWSRLQKVLANLRRTALPDVLCMIADARQPPLRSLPQALLDVPCTGTGTLRRHPDGKWRLQPADLEALVALQRQMLDAVAGGIAPGGLLVYSTCSLEPEENDLQIEQFLDRHTDFVVEPPPDFDARWLDGAVLRVLPQQHGFDGTFAARLRRSA